MWTHHKGPYDYELFKVSFPVAYVAHVEIDRANKLNSFKEPMWTNMAAIFNQLSHDDDVRCIVLSGSGEKAFTAGLDVEASSQDGITSADMQKADAARTAIGFRRHILEYQASVQAIEKCQKPVVVVMHGYSFGAAIDIATACDIRYCTKEVKACVKEVDIGLAADVGTLSRLPKIGVSLSWAKEVSLTARIFGSVEALRVGFVSEVLADKKSALARALEVAALIGSKSPVATLGTKHLIDYSRDKTIEDGLSYTATWNGAMLQSSDIGKAMLSSLKKQKMDYPKL